MTDIPLSDEMRPMITASINAVRSQFPNLLLPEITSSSTVEDVNVAWNKFQEFSGIVQGGRLVLACKGDASPLDTPMFSILRDDTKDKFSSFITEHAALAERFETEKEFIEYLTDSPGRLAEFSSLNFMKVMQ